MSNEKKSLVNITQGFIKILKDAEGKDVDIDKCEQELGISKRRIYDVSNVLEGVNLTSRNGRSLVRWTGNQSPIERLQPNLSFLEKERELDRLLTKANYELLDLMHSEIFDKFAYISKNDLLSILGNDFKNVYSISGSTDIDISMNELQDNVFPYRLVCKVPNGFKEIEYRAIINNYEWNTQD